jgi:hypothetical protein
LVLSEKEVPNIGIFSEIHGSLLLNFYIISLIPGCLAPGKETLLQPFPAPALKNFTGTAYLLI